MKHWPEYEMQSAPCTNDLESELRHRRADRRMSSSVFSRASTTRSMPSSRITRAPLASCTVICVEPWISKPGIDRVDEPHEPDVLHDRRVDAAIDRLAEEHQRVAQLVGLDEHVAA